MNESEFWFPLLLTFLAGISTGIGSLISLFIKKFKKSYLRFCLGFSAGVMIYVSFVELFSSSVSEIGFLRGNIAFFSGMLLFFFVFGTFSSEPLNLFPLSILFSGDISLSNEESGTHLNFKNQKVEVMSLFCGFSEFNIIFH